MNLEKLSNYDLLELFKKRNMYAIPFDQEDIEKIQEEIFSRMEVEGTL